MTRHPTVQYQILIKRDPETASIVVEVPALQLADFGADVPEALERVQAMVAFHVDCLIQEGKRVPSDPGEESGLYLRVALPPDAA